MSEPLDLDLDAETAEYAAAQQREYGKWEAAELIAVGNAPAYNVGDPVPISNVDRLGYAERGQVRLQHAYVENNPDDDDVKTFREYAGKYPDHPAVKSWKRYEEARKAEQDADDSLPPLTFGRGKTKATKKAAPAAKPSAATKSDKES
jgi:hypothetical protein